MKITKWALSAALAATCFGGSAFAQAPASPSVNDYYAQEAAPVVSPASLEKFSSVVPASCGCTDTPISDCGAASGCDSGCDSGCGGLGGGLGGGFLDSIDFGGWMSLGWHSARNSMFNDRDNEVNLHQAWLYAERVADGSNGLGFGGRIDYVYGIDAQDTQAFGINNNHWDNGWDNGGDNGYGHAIPQLYGEVAYGDLSVKAGHFFTLEGYEVVGATGNFFYSQLHHVQQRAIYPHGCLG